MKASPPAFIIKIEQRHSGQILDKLSLGISIYKTLSFCLATMTRPAREAGPMPQKRKGSYQVKLIPIGTHEQAAEALEAAVGIVIESAPGVLCSRKNESDVENIISVSVRYDVGGKLR